MPDVAILCDIIRIPLAQPNIYGMKTPPLSLRGGRMPDVAILCDIIRIPCDIIRIPLAQSNRKWHENTGVSPWRLRKRTYQYAINSNNHASSKIRFYLTVFYKRKESKMNTSPSLPKINKGEGNTHNDEQLSLLPFYPVIEKPKPVQKKTKITYAVPDSFLKLCEIQEMALGLSPKPDFTAALRSEELKGKLFSLYSEKKETEKSLENLPQILVEFIDRQVHNQLSDTSNEIPSKSTLPETRTIDETQGVIEFV